MKYSILGFNQEVVVKMSAVKEVKGKLVEVKLDISDLLILQSIADFMNRPKIQKTIIDDKIYCWVKHSVILEDLPILNIKQQAFSDKLDKLVMFGLLEKQTIRNQTGTMSYFRIGENYEKLRYSDGKCSQTQVRNDSQLHMRTCSQLQDKDYITNNNTTNNSTIIPPTPPKGRSKEQSSLNKIAKEVFEQYYQYVCHIPYYWSAKDAGNMKQILNKLKFQREQKNLSTDDDAIIYALKYLLQSIKDNWVKDNLSVSIINSKFNELINQAKNGTSKHNDSQDERRKSVANLKNLSLAILSSTEPEND